jgi:hypothetical protein
MTTTQTLRFGTTGTTGSWTGVIRRGTRVVAECGHRHTNRNYGAGSAADCIRGAVMDTRNGYIAVARARALDHAARARFLGARYTDEEALAKVDAVVAALTACGALTEAIAGPNGKPILQFDGVTDRFPAASY